GQDEGVAAHRSALSADFDGGDAAAAGAGVAAGVDLHLLALAQRADARALERGGVDEHVLLAIVRRTEAEAPLIVVELLGVRRHWKRPFAGCARGVWRTKSRRHSPCCRFWREC